MRTKGVFIAFSAPDLSAYMMFTSGPPVAISGKVGFSPLSRAFIRSAVLSLRAACSNMSGHKEGQHRSVKIRKEEYLCWPYLFNITHPPKVFTPFFDERANISTSSFPCQILFFTNREKKITRNNLNAASPGGVLPTDTMEQTKPQPKKRGAKIKVTPEMIRLQIELNPNRSMAELARVFGVSLPTLKRALEKEGIKLQRKKSFRAKGYASTRIFKTIGLLMHNPDMTYADISEQVHASNEYVSQIAASCRAFNIIK